MNKARIGCLEDRIGKQGAAQNSCSNSECGASKAAAVALLLRLRLIHDLPKILWSRFLTRKFARTTRKKLK